VQKAAYNAGDDLYLERERTRFRYGWRTDVCHSELIGSHGRSRQDLWNLAENTDGKTNSLTAREVISALPHELSLEQNVELARALGLRIHGRFGVAVDLNVHIPDPFGAGDRRNIHAHLLFTRRVMTHKGLNETLAVWDNKRIGGDALEELRADWAWLQNRALEHAKRPERVDHRSYARQGIARLPGVHLGSGLTRLERAGIPTMLGNSNRETAWANRLLAFLDARDLADLPSRLSRMSLDEIGDLAQVMQRKIFEILEVQRRAAAKAHGLPAKDRKELEVLLSEGRLLYRHNRERFFDALRIITRAPRVRTPRRQLDLDL